MPLSNLLLDRCRVLVLLPTLLAPATAARAPAVELRAPAVSLVATPVEPDFDCNQNGVEDSVDIAVGTSSDANWNAIPDECEDAGVGASAASDGPSDAPESLGYHGECVPIGALASPPVTGALSP